MPIDYSRKDFSARPIKGRGEVLRNANFSNATLPGADFERADLTDADFSYASIRGANFNNAILHNTNFSHAKIGLPITSAILFGILALFLTLLSKRSLITWGHNNNDAQTTISFGIDHFVAGA